MVQGTDAKDDEKGLKPEKLSILIVDDELNIRKTLTYCLEAEGYGVVAVSNATDALTEATRRVFDMAFVDLRLGEEDGMSLIPRLVSELPWLKIVVITAYASIETAVEAIKRGASDYLPKPFSPEQIRLEAKKMLQLRSMEVEIASLKDDLTLLEPEPRFFSQNVEMKKSLEMAKKAALSEAVILLRGESGTGKSILARSIHRWSSRAEKPLVIVSCPSIPAELLESEMFGHVKGAFTGAVKDSHGRIAQCEGGTLFLDEIAELPIPVQSKLLRFIQDREYERVGDPKTRKANVRLVAATNIDLDDAIKCGQFREDLYYRLNVISITIPPLRDRPEEIELYAMDYLKFFARINHKKMKVFSSVVIDALKVHQWPGNLRELRNAIERAVILSTGEEIQITDLPENIAIKEQLPQVGDKVSLATIEEQHIRRVLANTTSLQEAGEILGIDQATLWRRRKEYGI